MFRVCDTDQEGTSSKHNSAAVNLHHGAIALVTCARKDDTAWKRTFELKDFFCLKLIIVLNPYDVFSDVISFADIL